MGTWGGWRLAVAWLLVVSAVADLGRAVLTVLDRPAGVYPPLASVVRPADADPVPVAVLLALTLAGVLCLVVAPTRGSRAAAASAGVVLAVSGLVDLARLVVVAAAGRGEAGWVAATVGLAARLLVAAAGLVALARAPRPQRASGSSVEAAAAERTPPVPTQPPSSGPPATPAVRTSDPTAGTVWHRAGDAATGASGTVHTPGGEAPRGAPDWSPAPARSEPDEPR